MKTILKLLIAAAILHAVYRTGVSAATYYELKDSSQQMLIFGGGASPDQLQESILAKAEELSVALAPENVVVERVGVRTTAEASYTDPVEIFPRYRYPFNYSFRVEAISMRPQQ
jgi:hypothetical protein